VWIKLDNSNLIDKITLT